MQNKSKFKHLKLKEITKSRDKNKKNKKDIIRRMLQLRNKEDKKGSVSTKINSTNNISYFSSKQQLSKGNLPIVNKDLEINRLQKNVDLQKKSKRLNQTNEKVRDKSKSKGKKYSSVGIKKPRKTERANKNRSKNKVQTKREQPNCYLFRKIIQSKLEKFNLQKNLMKDLKSFNKEIYKSKKNLNMMNVRRNLRKMIKISSRSIAKSKKFRKVLIDFFQINELQKIKSKRKSLSKLKKKKINEIFKVQSSMRIPKQTVKKYFNCISLQIFENSILGATEIDSNFLRFKIQNSLKKNDFMKIVKKNRICAETIKSDFDNSAKKIETVNLIKNFGIDICLMKEFFDKEIKLKHIKIKKGSKNVPQTHQKSIENTKFQSKCENQFKESWKLNLEELRKKKTAPITGAKKLSSNLAFFRYNPLYQIKNVNKTNYIF